MYLPGKNALYLSQSLKFVSPCFVDDEVTVEGKVLKKSSSTRIITLETKITKESNINIVIGEAKVMVRGTDIVIR
jgi:3-hydroxybutyryl-CoA dehydratase